MFELMVTLGLLAMISGVGSVIAWIMPMPIKRKWYKFMTDEDLDDE